MSVKALSHVWENSKQRGARLLVLLALADNANDDGFSWYAMAKLAKKARQDADATRDYIRAIETDGELIVYERRTEDGKMNHTNLYKVLFPGATEELPPDLKGQLRRRPALPPKPPRKRKKAGVKTGGTGGFSEGGGGENHQSDPSVDPSVKDSVPSGTGGSDKPKQPRPRKPFEDAIVQYIIGVDPLIYDNWSFVGKLKKQIVKADADANHTDVADFAKWCRDEGFNPPNDADKLYNNWLKWRTAAPIYASTGVKVLNA